jgi:amidase
LLDISAGYLPGDPYTAPPPERPFLAEIGRPVERLRIAISADPPGGDSGAGGGVAPECIAAFEDAAKLLRELGHDVELAAPQADWAALDAAFFTIMAVQTRLVMELRAAGRSFGEQDFEGVTWAMAEYGRDRSALDYLRAVQVFHRTGRAVDVLFQSFDVLLTPSLAHMPPPIGTLDTATGDAADFLRRTFQFAPFTKLFNATGQPAMSLPLYWTKDNLPVGVQIVGRYGAEGLLFRLAAQLEAARPWADRLPPLLA